MKFVSSATFIIAVLTALRFALAAYLPLSFDETYFWLWSKHLAVSYYDHPPMIALAIRLGTLIFGDSEFGARSVSLMASVGASFAVWYAASLLIGEATAGATACCLFNLTLMVAAEAMTATPDALVLAAASFLLLSIAKVEVTGDGRWWLAAGLATGLAFLTKYTAFFLAGSVAGWLVLTPQGRVWLRSIWPYAGALIALAFLVPTLAWNAMHGWISFKYQFGRVVTGGPTLRFVPEFILGQLALASPFVLVLGGVGWARASAGRPRSLAFAAIIVWPALVYFFIHSLHERVQANWPSFVYPAIAVLAASAIAVPSRHPGVERMLRTSRALVLPVAASILLAAYAQAFFGFLPLGARDPIARMTAIGLVPVTERISALVRRNNDAAIVTTKYSTTGWLAFYLHPHVPIVQISEDHRWLSSARPNSDLFRKPLLYVTQNPGHEFARARAVFAKIDFVEALNRERGGIVIDRFYIYSLSGYHGNGAGRIP